MKCQSRILKEYKMKKADCIWPETVYGPTDTGTLPVCGGDVTVKIRAVAEPDWGGTYPKIEIEAICTKCTHPWWLGRIDWESKVLHWDGWDVTALLEHISETHS